ncbi:MAG: hypothetical protein AVDCRST_MAG68-2899, partial [uncultured Gemmatimonadetes bacterium]
ERSRAVRRPRRAVRPGGPPRLVRRTGRGGRRCGGVAGGRRGNAAPDRLRSFTGRVPGPRRGAVRLPGRAERGAGGGRGGGCAAGGRIGAGAVRVRERGRGRRRVALLDGGRGDDAGHHRLRHLLLPRGGRSEGARHGAPGAHHAAAAGQRI